MESLKKPRKKDFKMPLFEVAILEVPTKKQAEEHDQLEKLAFGPIYVIAKDGQSAAIKAVLENPEKASGIDKSRMQVLVRPFA
jgi:hypothetical protein